MNYREFTALIRPLSFESFSNLYAIAISILIVLFKFMYLFISEDQIEEAIIPSLSAGLFIFVLWAIVREVEPDNHQVSIISSLAASPIIVLLSFINPLELIVMLIAIRFVNRTVGKLPTEIDFLILSGASVLYTLFSGNWHVLFIVFSTLILDLILEPDWEKYKRAGTIGVIFPMFYFLSFAIESEIYIDSFRALNLLSVSFVIIFLLLTSRKYISKCDIGGNKLDSVRINSGQFIFSLFVISSTFTAEKYLEFVSVSIPIYFLFISLFGMNLWRIGRKRIIERMVSK